MNHGMKSNCISTRWNPIPAAGMYQYSEILFIVACKRMRSVRARCWDRQRLQCPSPYGDVTVVLRDDMEGGNRTHLKILVLRAIRRPPFSISRRL